MIFTRAVAPHMKHKLPRPCVATCSLDVLVALLDLETCMIGIRYIHIFLKYEGLLLVSVEFSIKRIPNEHA